MNSFTRRTWLRLSAATLAGSAADWRVGDAAEDSSRVRGYVKGEPTGEQVGDQVLAEGGNAFDAIVAAAFAVTVAAPNQTGMGGYGAHGVFCTAGGKRVVALDANSTAPGAMSTDAFRPDADGKVPGRKNEFGWLAAGVPGVAAGLDLVLKELGTRPLAEVLEPSIRLAREGYAWPASLAAVIRNGPQFAADPGSRQLYFREGQPLPAGGLFCNPWLADVLESFAKAGSVEPMYRGDVADRIAEAFQKNGGLVTREDLAAYRARLVPPDSIEWNGFTLHTAPLTAGGLTVLQALRCLEALDWRRMPEGFRRTHTAVEALRLAWYDRLTQFGDPDFVQTPREKLLSADYARESAGKVEQAVRRGGLIEYPLADNPQGGTIHLSAADVDGNFAALTLTHGGGFGARVTVEDLGLTLGHGMSRFDPRPGHPNAPAPGKRPLNNMSPTILTRDGAPVCAVGGRGGRKIPNALFGFLTSYAGLERSLDEAMAAPRLHTEGTASLEATQGWPAEEVASLRQAGYRVRTAGSATLSAVALVEGRLRAAMR